MNPHTVTFGMLLQMDTVLNKQKTPVDRVMIHNGAPNYDGAHGQDKNRTPPPPILKNAY